MVRETPVEEIIRLLQKLQNWSETYVYSLIHTNLHRNYKNLMLDVFPKHVADLSEYAQKFLEFAKTYWLIIRKTYRLGVKFNLIWESWLLSQLSRWL